MTYREDSWGNRGRRKIRKSGGTFSYDTRMKLTKKNFNTYYT